jgi:hypothetical protein
VLVVLAGALREQAELIRCLVLLLPQVAVEAHQIVITPQVQAGQVAAVIIFTLQRGQTAIPHQHRQAKATTAAMGH